MAKWGPARYGGGLGGGGYGAGGGLGRGLGGGLSRGSTPLHHSSSGYSAGAGRLFGGGTPYAPRTDLSFGTLMGGGRG